MADRGAQHESRRAALRAAVEATGEDVDAVLITSLVDVRYLSGFSGSNAALLVPVSDSDDALLATDGRYTTQAAEESPDLALVVARACASALAEQAGGSGLVSLGFDPRAVTVDELDQLRRASPTVRFVPVGPHLRSQRAVEDGSELSLLREACEISVAALGELLEAESLVGRSERDVAASLELRMRRLGADGAAFETIVGTGPNSAIPHHSPTDRTLDPGDLVVVDFGARVGGYHADMTRTFVVGEPAGWQTELVDLVADAQHAGREALVAGAACASVDAAARSVIEEAGFGDRFPHGTGHGVGLEIHEAPALAAGAPGRLADRMPVTVEPGVYLPGRGGVRIEDTLVVTGESPVALTTTSRELRILR